jgi:ATP-dependent RNA/DNA helicase IGHMBP2
MSDSIVAEFVAEQRELLNLEFEADSDETANTSRDERAAHILQNLEASDLSVGLYGRTVVELSLVGDNAAGEVRLPAHRFTVGDEVQIRKQNKKNCPTGVISAVSDTFISVALSQKDYKGGKDAKSQSKKKNGADDDEDEVGVFSQPPFSLVPMSSVQVHRKLVRALDVLEKQGAGHPIAGRIVEAMFNPESKFNEPETGARSEIQPFNPNLDQSQLEAISFALQSHRSIALIHGPPGTGKTTTIAELIHQAVHVHKMKVLVRMS